MNISQVQPGRKAGASRPTAGRPEGRRQTHGLSCRASVGWDGRNLVRRDRIRAFCHAVARRFKPDKIVLFGSYAYGQPTPDSDVDLMVIMPLRRGLRPAEQAYRIRLAFDAPFALDLLVRTPAFVADRMRERDMFIEEVMTRGRVMYEDQHA
jgi:uncharacterized protein